MSAMYGPHVALNHVFLVSCVRATAASELPLPSVSVHVALEVAGGVGAVGAVGAGERLLTCVNAHMFLHISDKTAAIWTVGAIVHLPVAMTLAYSCTSSPAALHHLLGMLSLLSGCQTPIPATLIQVLQLHTSLKEPE